MDRLAEIRAGWTVQEPPEGETALDPDVAYLLRIAEAARGYMNTDMGAGYDRETSVERWEALRAALEAEDD
jgi:hypothetical protein|tara:strand:+ start:6748 stop:6960 length:213 start_codon:yes stop_codon:yes gene_type:complete